MVLLDYLEVEVQYGKKPFEEQERDFFRQLDYESTRLRVAVAWATLLLRGLTTKDKGQKSKR